MGGGGGGGGGGGVIGCNRISLFQINVFFRSNVDFFLLTKYLLIFNPLIFITSFDSLFYLSSKCSTEKKLF